LDALKEAASDHGHHTVLIEQVRSSFRSKLKTEQGFLEECLQADLLHLLKETPEKSLTPAPLNKVLRLLESIQTARIGEKFQHLMVQAFAEGTTRLLSKLSDQSPAIRSQAKNFLQGGVKKWQSGENRPPKEVQRLIY
jgi:hypothetical protein